MNEKKLCLLQMRIWFKIKKPVGETVAIGRDINMDVVPLADLLASLVSKQKKKLTNNAHISLRHKRRARPVKEVLQSAAAGVCDVESTPL